MIHSFKERWFQLTRIVLTVSLIWLFFFYFLLIYFEIMLNKLHYFYLPLTCTVNFVFPSIRTLLDINLFPTRNQIYLTFTFFNLSQFIKQTCFFLNLSPSKNPLWRQSYLTWLFLLNVCRQTIQQQSRIKWHKAVNKKIKHQ